MSISYFPAAYFGYVTYGTSAATFPFPDQSSNWVYEMLEGIASSLASLYGTSTVRIFVDPNDFYGNDSVPGTIIEIAVKSLDSVPVSFSTDSDFLIIQKTDVRVRLRSTSITVRDVALAMSRTIQNLTSNDFGNAGISYRSRVIESKSTNRGQGDYDLRFVLETQQIAAAN